MLTISYSIGMVIQNESTYDKKSYKDKHRKAAV